MLNALIDRSKNYEEFIIQKGLEELNILGYCVIYSDIPLIQLKLNQIVYDLLTITGTSNIELIWEKAYECAVIVSSLDETIECNDVLTSLVLPDKLDDWILRKVTIKWSANDNCRIFYHFIISKVKEL